MRTRYRKESGEQGRRTHTTAKGESFLLSDLDARDTLHWLWSMKRWEMDGKGSALRRVEAVVEGLDVGCTSLLLYVAVAAQWEDDVTTHESLVTIHPSDFTFDRI